MAKRKTGYLRGLSRAAYNALQRYNRLAREDGLKALAPGKVKDLSKKAGMTQVEYIRSAEEANLGPRLSRSEERMVDKLRRIEKSAGKRPTSRGAIRRSIAELKAQRKGSPWKRGKRSAKNATRDTLARLEAKALDIRHPYDVRWLEKFAEELDAWNTALEILYNLADGKDLYVKGRGMLTAGFELVKDELYDFKQRKKRKEFKTLADEVAADKAIAEDARRAFVDVTMHFKLWQDTGKERPSARTRKK